MPIISFANAKGGAGKTTAALLLATELAERGSLVTIVDADPQRWISQWATTQRQSERTDLTDRIAVIDQVTPVSIASVLREEAERREYIIVDLEGALSPLVAGAVAVSDLVLVPIQGCAMDARGGGKILDLIAALQREERRTIAHSVILTRINAAVTTRALRAVRDHLFANNIDVLATSIVERAAFRDIFDTGGTLRDLDRRVVTNLDKALANVDFLASEIVERMANQAQPQPARPARRFFRLAA